MDSLIISLYCMDLKLSWKGSAEYNVSVSPIECAMFALWC